MFVQLRVKFLYWLIVALLCAPAILFAHGTGELVVIEMTTDGFAPSDVVIAPHTTVIFQNNSPDDRWPATDDHPNHTLFDGTDLETHCSDAHNHATFDACGSVAPGERWLFTFEEPGEYPFHDHLWPHFGGVITVIADNAEQAWWQQMWSWVLSLFATSRDASVLRESDDLLPYQRSSTVYDTTLTTLLATLETTDPGDAIAELQQLGESDPIVLSLCHDLLHEIGRAAYERYGSFETAVVYMSDYCNSGYIHGLFEAYFTEHSHTETSVAALCNTYAADRRPFDKWQCEHGVGHGFMYVTGGKLDESLALCAREFSGSAVQSCINGAYMEVMNLEQLAYEPQFSSAEEIIEFCQQAEVGTGDCYLYIPAYLIQVADWSYGEILTTCINNLSGSAERSCVQGVASEAMKRTMSDPAAVLSMCEAIDDDSLQTSCVSGLTSMYINQMGDVAPAVELCNTTLSAHTRTCERVIAKRAGDFM